MNAIEKIDDTISFLCEFIKKEADLEVKNRESIARLTLSLAELVSAREQCSGF